MSIEAPNLKLRANKFLLNIYHIHVVTNNVSYLRLSATCDSFKCCLIGKLTSIFHGHTRHVEIGGNHFWERGWANPDKHLESRTLKFQQNYSKTFEQI